MAPEEARLYADLFLTPWGWVGAVYSAAGLRRLTLPRAESGDVEERLDSPGKTSLERRPWSELRRLVRRYFEGAGEELDLPLDIDPPGRSTELIWNAVKTVPYGNTVTYAEAAARAGLPGRARAAGRAMGRNPVPLFIPCHRVVASAGIGGFSGDGGVEMKARLLNLEKDAVGRREGS